MLGEEAVARVIGDDLRRFLPGYEEHRRAQPLEMPSLTAAGSGELVRRCIQYANERRLSIMLEGTWLDPVMILGAVEDAWRLGRRTHAVVVAVPPVISLEPVLFFDHAEIERTVTATKSVEGASKSGCLRRWLA